MVLLLKKNILFDYIMENCQNIISVNDLNHNYISCNKAFLKHLGMHHESEVLNKNIKEILPYESCDIIKNYLFNAVKDREPKIYTYKQKNRVIKQVSIPIVEDCEITGILSIASDITTEENLKYKLMEKICQLNNTIEKEKKLKVQKEMFLATLTHDLKNPVQALLMTLKMFKNGMFGGLKPEQSDILDTAIESADYMQKMLHSILATYKLDNGTIELKKTYINVVELINKCIKENDALAKNNSIKIIYINQNIDNKLYADEARLRRVIGNLLNNALTYSDKNTELTIFTNIQKNNMIFNFTNIGNPIPNEVKEHIFEKYYTSNSMTGTGLGLYFSKKVIEAHGGKIYLKTNGNRISFIFELPLYNNDPFSLVKF